MAVTPVDIGGSFAKGLAIRDMQDQMRDRRQARQERNQMLSLASLKFGGVDPQTGITWKTGRQGSGAMSDDEFVGQAAAISPERAIDFQKLLSGQQAAKYEREVAYAPLVVGTLQGVQDQADYDRRLSMLDARGVDTSDWPRQFDPGTINLAIQGYKMLAQMKPESVAPGNTLVDPITGQPMFTAPNRPPQPTNLSKLIEERDALPLNDPNRPFYDQAITKATTSTPAATVNIGSDGQDYGKPPKDHAWARTADGKIALQPTQGGYMTPVAVPIAGGPEARDIAADEQAKGEAQRQRAVYADVVTKDIDRIINRVETSRFPVTGVGSFLSVIPGSDAGDVSAMLDGVKANIGFDRLQQMRDASPTGGALGQVSEFENRLLQATIGSLEQSQTKGQLIYNLRRVQRIYSDIVNVGIRPEDAGKYGRPMGPAGDTGKFGKMSFDDLISLDTQTLSERERIQAGNALAVFGY